MNTSISPKKHLETAFNNPNPREYFDTLREEEVLNDIFPEIGALVDVPAGPPGTHLEGDAYEHTMRVLEGMFELRGNERTALLAALAHDFGKARTEKETLPSHPRHPSLGIDASKDFADRLSLGKEEQDVMVSAAKYHMRMHVMDEMGSNKVMQLVTSINEQSGPFTVGLLLDLGEADHMGRESSDKYAEEFERELAEDRLGRAQEAFSDRNPKVVRESRNLDKEDIGSGEESEISVKNFKNIVHQERVERMRELKQ